MCACLFAVCIGFEYKQGVLEIEKLLSQLGGRRVDTPAFPENWGIYFSGTANGHGFWLFLCVRRQQRLFYKIEHTTSLYLVAQNIIADFLR